MIESMRKLVRQCSSRNLVFITLIVVLLMIIFNGLLKQPTTPRIRFTLLQTADIEKPKLLPHDGVWRPVAGTKHTFLVFSAFVQRKPNLMIRIIAAAKTTNSEMVECRIYLPDRTLAINAVVKAIRENWNMEYSASYVLCPLKVTDVKSYHEVVGASVSVVAGGTELRPTNLLIVQDTEPSNSSDYDNTISVCMQPLLNYGREDWLVEWFELQRQLGITHFYMYNVSLSGNTSCLIEHYCQKGLVTLFQWQLPFKSEVQIRVNGIFAALNDCLYRARSKSGWVAVIDLDEVLVPRRERTLQELLDSLIKNTSGKPPSGYIFQNAFFYVNWEDDPLVSSPLLTERKTRRLVRLHPINDRSKYVVRTKDAVELGNHFIWELVPDTYAEGVHVERGLLHHYRASCESGDGDRCLARQSTIDTTAHRWAKELNESVNKEKAALTESCSFRFGIFFWRALYSILI